VTGSEYEYVTMADVLEAARIAVGDYQIRDVGLLASAIARPQMSAFGQDAYPTLSDKAAALMHSLARNHCLVDGNKRLAWVCARLFCALNSARLKAPTVDEGEDLVLRVARGELDGPDLSLALHAWIDYFHTQPDRPGELYESPPIGIQPDYDTGPVSAHVPDEG
jgi:death-on-curing protein